METDRQRERLQLVWASVFLAVWAIYGFTMLLFSNPGSEMEPTALLMVFGMFFSVFAVPFLLLFASATPRLLLGGRILVSLQMACHVGALGCAILVILLN